MSDSESTERVKLTVESRAHGWRVDHYLARTFSNYSRALLQRAIEHGEVWVNGLPVKPSRKLRVNDIVSVALPELPDRSLPSEDIPLKIVFEDDVMVVIDKPAGMIVHPGRGHYYGTLAGALQFHFDSLSTVAGQMRPGIVHRLDRDTTGLLIVAKTNQIHHQLSGQFERREVTKEYRAIVHGVVDRDSDWIETFMKVDPRARERMCVCHRGGEAREAVTFYEVLERFEHYTSVKLLPKTGRTHQLRVHMRHIGHPIVADRVYGGRQPVEFAESHPIDSAKPELDRTATSEEPDLLELDDLSNQEPTAAPSTSVDQSLICRQALHAHRLQIQHPVSRQPLDFVAPLPADMQELLTSLSAGRVKR